MDMHPAGTTLNDYVDQALTGAERSSVERHLESCAACRAIVDDLQAIRRASSTLAPIDPPPAAWERIEAAIRAEAPGGNAGRRVVLGLNRQQIGWLGIAAAVLLATYIGLRLGPLAPDAGDSADTTTTAADTTGTIESVESELRQAEEHYTKAISGLEQIASEGEGELDPETAATLQKSLAVVDQAIDESRAAVRSEPTNETAQTSLLENFSTKIALLQDTVALINEMRKGNDAGAAQIVSGLK